jgi:hypothetical protein
MRSMPGRLVFIVAALAALAVSTGSAAASTPSRNFSAVRPLRFAGGATGVPTATSSNWAGYAVSAPTTTLGAVTATPSFTKVTGSWVEPVARCTTGTSTYSAFWVGLGGFSRDSQALEQIGTEANCSATDAARHDAWYELIPAAPVPIKLKIRSGDTISATVTVTGHTVSLRFRDVTRHTLFTKKLRMSAPDVSAAEWIAEAPSACDQSGRCRALPLTNFGAVSFSKATATAGGHSGTISDPAWAATAIELHADRMSTIAFGDSSPLGNAVPGDLLGDGSAFGVTWQQAS